MLRRRSDAARQRRQDSMGVARSSEADTGLLPSVEQRKARALRAKKTWRTGLREWRAWSARSESVKPRRGWGIALIVHHDDDDRSGRERSINKSALDP